MILLFISTIGFSLLVGILNYRWLKPIAMKAFVPFLAITLATEILGAYSSHVRVSNGMLYNIYLFIQVTFCCFFFRSFLTSAVFKRIINAAIVTYVAANLIIYLFVSSVHDFNKLLFLLGGFLVVLFAIFFLFEYFSNDNQQQETVLEPVIWIAVGLITYFAVLSVTVSFLENILFYALQIGGVKLHNFVPRMLSIIMYLCFAYSFYRCRTLNRK